MTNHKIIDDCWYWFGAKNHGRGELTYHKKVMLAHRFYYEKFIGPIPTGLFVCHHCDNPACVNPKHLFLGTAADNTRDMWNKGRAYAGFRVHPPDNSREKNPRHKLTEGQVKEIRERYVPYKVSTYKLAKEYGVTQQNVSYIVNNKSWRT